MFKIILLQDWNIVSDDSAEYLGNCHLNLMRFLGVEMGKKSPDAKTIWLFKEQLGKEGLRELFELFNKNLYATGVIKREGSLVDATFVDAPKQRNSRGENKTIKSGEFRRSGKVPKIPTNSHKRTPT